MTRYEQGFIKRAEELGYDGENLLSMSKKSYELGSTSPRYRAPNLRDTNTTFFPSSTDPVTVPDHGAGVARATGAMSSLPSRWDKFITKFNRRPRGVREQMCYYKAITHRHNLDDGLIRRLPIVEDGKYNSTFWKDNLDLANLQSDAIRRRRGAGKPLVFDPKIQRYRPQ